MMTTTVANRPIIFM